MLQIFGAPDAKPNLTCARCALFRLAPASIALNLGPFVGLPTLEGENDLADMLAAVHAGMGLGHVGEGEARIDHRPAPPLGQQRPDLVLEGAGDQRPSPPASAAAGSNPYGSGA